MSRDSSSILVVDDNPDNLNVLSDLLDQKGFELLFALDGEAALERAEFTQPDLILLDVMMPGIDGFETCRRLKANTRTAEVPIIFMTALSETVNKVKGFELGAVDYITKPIEPEEALARVRTHLTIQRLQNDLRLKNDELQEKKDILVVQQEKLKRQNVILADRELHLSYLVEEKTQRIENLTLALVGALEHANALSDTDTRNHIRRIGRYAAFIAQRYGCEQDFVKRIMLYAPLHDIGKIGLSDALLKKRGRYTAEEFISMQNHVIHGSRILANEEIDVMVRNIVLYHHEKWDGTGYVHQLAGEAIPLEARITALVDVYDALISKRVYKAIYPEEKSFGIIREGAGKHFDPDLVEIFFNHRKELRDLRTLVI